MHQISLLTRMRLETMAEPLAMVPFSSKGYVYCLVTSSSALEIRRAVAEASSLATLNDLRKSTPSRDAWKSLQAQLRAAGLTVCPTSGTPVLNLDSCSRELKDALFGVMVAMQKAVNNKEGLGEFETALKRLEPLVKEHAAQIIDLEQQLGSSSGAVGGGGGALLEEVEEEPNAEDQVLSSRAKGKRPVPEGRSANGKRRRP